MFATLVCRIYLDCGTRAQTAIPGHQAAPSSDLSCGHYCYTSILHSSLNSIFWGAHTFLNSIYKLGRWQEFKQFAHPTPLPSEVVELGLKTRALRPENYILTTAWVPLACHHSWRSQIVTCRSQMKLRYHTTSSGGVELFYPTRSMLLWNPSCLHGAAQSLLCKHTSWDVNCNN